MDIRTLRTLAEDRIAERPAKLERAREHTPLLYELRVHQVMVELLKEELRSADPDAGSEPEPTVRSLTRALGDVFEALQSALDEGRLEETELSRLIGEGATLTARLEAFGQLRSDRPPLASAASSGTRTVARGRASGT